MIRNNLNVPANLVYTKNGEKHTLQGQIISINENTSSCDIKFNLNDGTNKVYNNVPMSSIEVDEAFLDTVKQAGQTVGRAIGKAVNWVITKIKGGYLALKGNNGEVIVPNAPINMGIAAAQGKIPADCPYGLQVSQALKDAAASNGVSVANRECPSDDEDLKEIKKFWTRVIKNYTNSNKSVSESIKYVKNKFYKKPLNEAVWSLKAHDDLGIIDVNTKQLKYAIRDSVRMQIAATVPGKSSSKGTVLLIWGAPGIGKTAIVSQAMNMFDELNLVVTSVNCAQCHYENMSLPSIKAVGDESVEVSIIDENLRNWLPCYDVNGKTAYEIKRLDDLYNSNLNPTGGTNGGILFLDEFSRMNTQTKNAFMNLVNAREFDNKVLASKWAMICAANRATDLNFESSSSFTWEDAFGSRFKQVNFVPTKKEWLDWANSINPATGESYVDEFICAFIENTPDAVWYDALDLGSRPEVADRVGANMTSEEIETLLQDPALAKKTTTWNQRTYEKISNDYRDKVKYLNADDIDDTPEKIKLVQDRRWREFYDAYADVCDPGESLFNNKDGFIKKWVGNVLVPSYTGKKSLPQDKFNEYVNYLSVCDEEQCHYIWNHGTMNKKVPEDAYGYPSIGDFSKDTKIKWKSSYSLQELVLKRIESLYPGGVDQMKKDFDNMVKAAEAYDKLDYAPGKIEKPISKSDWDNVIDNTLTTNYIEVSSPGNEKSGKQVDIQLFYDDEGDAIKDQFDTLVEYLEMGTNKSEEDTVFFVNASLYNGIRLLNDGCVFLTRICNLIKYFVRVAKETKQNKIFGALEVYLIGAIDSKTDLETDTTGIFNIQSIAKSSLIARLSTSNNILSNKFYKLKYCSILYFISSLIRNSKKVLNEQ